MQQEIIKFWFEDLEPKQWWVKDLELDRLIIDRFSKVHDRAARCELSGWRKSAAGRLAEIIILDQFSRNMFRGLPRSFAYDAMALVLSQEAIATGADQLLSPVERNFIYMPFMHSESLQIHEDAVELFRRNGQQSNFDYELKHKAIIEKFGRYPHRNAILGRESTAEEIDFLQKPGSSF
jgi:uncharacterized protein (DUF924 family)